MEQHSQDPQKIETIESTKELQASTQENLPCQIAFIGNVDSGTSKICEDLFLLTGAIDREKLVEMEKEYPHSNKAWVRCLTEQPPEVQRIRLKTPEKEFDILNTFMGTKYRNFHYLLKESQQLDALCIVVSASRGEFEAGFDRDGWTKQCLKIAAVVGIQRLVIIVNKMDHQTVCWAQERYQEIKDEITKFLKKLQFDQNRVDWIPVSALSKENIMTSIAHPSGSWYKGPTFLKLLNQLPISNGDLSGPTRVGVSQKFKGGEKMKLIGQVQSGILRQDQEMMIIPNLQKLSIKEIHDDWNKPISLAKPGESVKITIETKDPENSSILEENIVGLSSDLPTICSEIECEITILELPKSKPLLTAGSGFVIHLHNIIQEALITSVQDEYDEKEKADKKVDFLKSWSKGIVHIAEKNGDPIYCEKFSILPKLGKFFLCDGDEQMPIAYGTILRIKPIKNK